MCVCACFRSSQFLLVCMLTWFERDMWRVYLFTCFALLKFELNRFFFFKRVWISTCNISMIKKIFFFHKNLPDFQLELCDMKRIKEASTCFVWVLNLKDKLSHDRSLCLMNQSLPIHHETSKRHDFLFLINLFTFGLQDCSFAPIYMWLGWK